MKEIPTGDGANVLLSTKRFRRCRAVSLRKVMDSASSRDDELVLSLLAREKYEDTSGSSDEVFIVQLRH